jgi:rhamnogalacturonan endolyase
MPRTPLVEPLEPRRLLASAVTPILAARDAADALPARQMEYLDRGVVAVKTGTSTAYVGWRLLGTDPTGVAFNVYRSTSGAAPVKRNATPITASTNFADTSVTATASHRYFVRPVINGVEQADSESFTIAANAPTQQYLSVPLQIPPGGTTPTGEAYTYSAGDTSVGDVDGDGQYELIVKWEPSNGKDNSQSGYTGNVFIDAYRLNGTRLWRIDLGVNIRAGAHYTQFMVYDLDGDGRAEVAMKTAPGTIDGRGVPVLLPGDAVTDDYRNSSGYILSGPEYLSVFDGLSGAALATTPYIVPRGNVSSWGDNYGNRVDRFLAAVAYLDGQRPSLVMCRGYYTRAVLVAFDFRNGQLTRRWTFDSDDGTPGNAAYRGQGAHSLSVADVDADGRDEIIYGAATIDDNGRGLYSTGLGHGDALHVSDMDPARPGLEVFQIHESEAAHQGRGGTYRDARTGAVLGFVPGAGDVGRGLAIDLDPRAPGFEMWTTSDANIWNVSTGQVLQAKPSNMMINFAAWWDADPLRELLDGTTISDWRITNGVGGRFNLLSASGVSSNNGTKSTPALSADLLGDWREEVIWKTTDSSALRIYTTTIPATMRLPTLMHDPQYRVAIAWQNVAYNQPPHPSFFLGDGMTTPPPPNIYVAGGTFDARYQAEWTTVGGGSIVETTNAGFNGTAYINFPTTGGFVQWSNVEAGAGGTRSIRFRYALGATTARTGNLVVNGTATPITFQPTGSWTTWQTITLTVPLNPGVANTIRLESTGQDLANIDQLDVLLPLGSDANPPQVLSRVHTVDAWPTTLRYAFSENVSESFSLSDVVVHNIDTAATVSPTGWSYDLVTNTATITLPTNLPQGRYRASFAAGALADAAGNPMAANAFDFSFLRGDLNRDGFLSNQDIAPFVQALTDPAGFAAAFGYPPLLLGDMNGDGVLNNQDLAPFVAALTGGRPTPTSPPPTSSPTTLSSNAARFGSRPVLADAMPGRITLLDDTDPPTRRPRLA